MNAQAIIANLPELVDALKDSVKTDIKTGGPAEAARARRRRRHEEHPLVRVRARASSPQEFLTSPRGYIITPNVARIRQAVDQAFKVTPELLARRERLESEGASVWVLNGSGRAGLETSSADVPRVPGAQRLGARGGRSNERPSKTKIVVYNGAEADLPETIKYLERRFETTVTTATDPERGVDIVDHAGQGRARTWTSTPSADGRRPAHRRRRDAGRSIPRLSPRRASASSGTRRRFPRTAAK